MSEWTGISGSGAGDVAACPARAAFPQCRTSGDYADRGIALHKFAQMVTLYPKRRDEFLADVPEEWRHTAAGMDVAAALDGVLVQACEISYAVNVKDRTARLIGTNIDRAYEAHLAACGEAPLGLYEIPMTLDVEGIVDINRESVPIEIDYKSGQSVGAVEDHFQRKMSSAALMFYYGASETISRVAYIWDDGTIHQEGHEFTLIDAWDTCDVMVEAIDRVLAARAKLARGESLTVYPDREKQCKYCDAFTVCPYWSNLLWSANVGLDEVGKAVSAEQKGKALDYVKDVLKVAKVLEDQLKEHAAREPLPVDDVYEYVASSKAGKSYFDQAGARGLLATLLLQSGLSDEAVFAKLATLNKTGKSYPEVRKRKKLSTKTVQETNAQ